MRTHSMKTLTISLLSLGLVLITSLNSCKKFIEVDSPPTSVNGGNAYADNTTASAVLTGIYARMSNRWTSGDVTSLSLFPELSSDNLSLFENSNTYYLLHYQNAIDPQYTTTNGFSPYWNNLYQLIYTANAAIEGVTDSETLTPGVKQRCLGEAYFIRAFCYFYLVNLYGNLPIVVSTDYEVNAKLARSPVTEVYALIESDLGQAKSLLDTRYVDATLLAATTERVRPNSTAASALLARVYLFEKKYIQAESEASAVISQSTNYGTTALNAIFLKNSRETIWALQPVKANFNTDEGFNFIPSASGLNSTNPFYLNPNLMSSFEAGDLRRSSWTSSLVQGGITYYYPTKYKVKTNATQTEYTIVLRLSEQYLIRAEARNEQDNTAGAQSDLNVIRNRAGLGNTPANVQATLRAAILKERRSEFFTEWGHRWFDLNRTGNIDAVMSVIAPLKGGSWASYKALYPIPVADLLRGINLTQNSGYQ